MPTTTKIRTLGRLLRRLLGLICFARWFVECDWCGVEYGANGLGRGRTFRRRDDADAAARADGWRVDDNQELCPVCSAVITRT